MKFQWYCENIHAISGYSDEARSMVRGLIDQGVEVKIVGRNNRPGGGEFSFQSHIEPNIPVVYHTFRHGNYSLDSRSYGIVRTMLEVTRIPQNWVFRLNQLDEIWVPNGFNFDLFARSGVNRERMFIIPSPVDSDSKKNQAIFELKTRKHFIFLSLFNYSARFRKGLDVLLKAYTETFEKDDDVCLVIKTNTTPDMIAREYNLSSGGPEIEVVNRVLDKKSLNALFRAANCFVLPSRGEGVGRPYLEALSAGVPIIATGWGGHCDFLNPRNSHQIKFKLVDVDRNDYICYPGFFGSQWAEPEIKDLKQKMIQVVEQHPGAVEMANRGRQQLSRFSIDHVCRLIIDRLKNPLPARNDVPRIANLFERLYPLYYPHLKSNDDVYRLHRRAFQNRVESVAIFGTGHRARRVFNYVRREVGVPKILFIDDGAEETLFFNCPLRDLSRYSPGRDPVELIVIGARLYELGERFNLLIRRIDTLPVYFFD